jgi:SAM-dependent methyltransferase
MNVSEPFSRAPHLNASFRDPAGSVFCFQGRILRLVTSAGAADLSVFLESSAARKLMSVGTVVATRALSQEESLLVMADTAVRDLYEARFGVMMLEHERIDFPNFPYEWAPEMLHAAALLTLDVAQALLADGLGLKDATPYNILFRGPDPVFVDLLSFERRDLGDTNWLPYGQFVRTFLLPLLASKTYGLNLDQMLTTRRDGLEPKDVYRLTTPFQRLRPPFFGLVSVPTWLGARHNKNDASIYRKRRSTDPAKARFIVNALLSGLRRTLRRLEPETGARSTWSDYMSTDNNYSGPHFEAKERFVREALGEVKSGWVLDVGCNTGHFSALAARDGAKVVAVDYDPVVLGNVWRRARTERLDILPLVVDLTRPSPGTGWRNRECASFLDRARGKFDVVLMLGVIHHMLISERVPLAEILDLAAEVTNTWLLIEFVAPDDSMFRRLTRGREDLHRDVTVELFENLCQRRFVIVRSQHVENTARWLYLLRKRG